ncbi:MAG: sugar phosphate nucleotidyltransferase [Candidatus Poribacteria bacterium]|nr:sugar phosphate nucleotidyltransferase [Candidatus Poribacteria bacterium]
MQAIILCGGLATRLGETAKTIPKILLDIAGQTVLAWQIQMLKDVNVQEVILASGHLHDALYVSVGDDYDGVRIRYAREEKRLGTGGAIQNAMQYINTSPFFVLNGDVLLNDFSLQEMLDRFQKEMTGLLLSVRVDDIRQYGEILSDTDGKITAFREKQAVCRPGYINGGVYLFNRKIIGAFPKHQEVFSIERDVFPSVSNLYTLKTKTSWIDIGVPERLAYARQHFRNGASQ